jgi:BlaI family penicillinase repressor
MENLTAKEEEIMQILWNLQRAMVKEIMEKLPNSEQPYSTISSIVRILEKKGFISHKAYGKTHEYFPLVSKAEYRRRKFRGLLTGYFDNSIESMVSFLVKEEKMSTAEIEKLTHMISREEEKK